MPNTSDDIVYTPEGLKAIFFKSVAHVFQCNMGSKAELTKRMSLSQLAKDNLAFDEKVISTYVTVYQAVDMAVCIQCPYPLMYGVAKSLLGLDEADVKVDEEAVLADVCREMTNMISGSFVNVLAESGKQCRLKPPLEFQSPQALFQILKECEELVALRADIGDTWIHAILYN